jgi:hypothetical protein
VRVRQSCRRSGVALDHRRSSIRIAWTGIRAEPSLRSVAEV